MLARVVFTSRANTARYMEIVFFLPFFFLYLRPSLLFLFLTYSLLTPSTLAYPSYPCQLHNLIPIAHDERKPDDFRSPSRGTGDLSGWTGCQRAKS